jgi:hypothetical protein
MLTVRERFLKPNFRTRRLAAVSGTLLLVAVFAGWTVRETQRLGDPAWLTGFTLLSCLLLLVLLGVRRRLPVLPLGSARVWTQCHLYLGIFATAIYVMHVPALIADGRFESLLSMLFLATSLSGFYGIYVSRVLPKKLTAVEGQPRFDRVRWHRHQIAEAAGGILAGISESSAHEVLESFYDRMLKPFFQRRPSPGYVLAPNGVRRRKLLGELKGLHRYLERDGQRAAGQFAALVRRRDDLDYQYALQLRLRCWVVFHSIVSVLLVIAAIVHALIAIRFIG